MKILIIILNRLYFFLFRVNNQTPFFGAVGIAMLLIYANLNNLLLLYYSFKPISLQKPAYIDLVEMFFLFAVIYYYASNEKEHITNPVLFSSLRNNCFVVILIIFTVLSFVFLANVNREKIFKLQKELNIQTPRKESLEGRLRKWLND